MKKSKKVNSIFTKRKQRNFLKYSKKLSRKTIMNAISGDPIALMEVVDAYRPYIENLSMRVILNEEGNYKREVDETVKRTLETSLIAAVMKFNPFRK